jgi:hypothetical protein
MAYAAHEDMTVLRRYVSDDNFREALDKAPPGIIDPRSWLYWNSKMGRYPPPPPQHTGTAVVRAGTTFPIAQVVAGIRHPVMPANGKGDGFHRIGGRTVILVGGVRLGHGAAPTVYGETLRRISCRLVLDFGIQLAADQDADGPDASRAETALAAVGARDRRQGPRSGRGIERRVWLTRFA